MIAVKTRFLFMVAAATISIPAADGGAQPSFPPVAQQTTTEALPHDGLAAPAGPQCKTMRVLPRGVVAEAGKRLLEFVVQNSGAGTLSSAVSVDLSQKGETVAQFRTMIRGIGPGNSQRQRIDLSELPPGRYQALTIVQDREGEISGNRQDLELE